MRSIKSSSSLRTSSAKVSLWAWTFTLRSNLSSLSSTIKWFTNKLLRLTKGTCYITELLTSTKEPLLARFSGENMKKFKIILMDFTHRSSKLRLRFNNIIHMFVRNSIFILWSRKMEIKCCRCRQRIRILRVCSS